MAITHLLALRQKFANQVTTDLDAGGTAKVVFKAGGTPASTVNLKTPSFFAADGTATIALDVTPPPEDSAATGNASPVDTFEFQNNAGTAQFQGVTPGDITLSKQTIAPNDVVQITSFTYTACP